MKFLPIDRTHSRSWLCCMITTLCVATAACAGEVVNTIDGRTFAAQGLKISPKGLEFQADQKAHQLALADVAEIVLADAAALLDRPGQIVVEAASSMQLAACDMTLADSKLIFDNGLLGRCELPLDAARAIYLPAGSLTPQQVQRRCKELKLQAGASDKLILAKTTNDWVSAEGVLKSIDAAKLVFNYDDADRSVDRQTVRAIFVSDTGAGARPAMPAGTILGVDGSIASFTSLSWNDQGIEADVPTLGKRKIPTDRVAAIRFLSDRLVSLSSLKPIEVKEYGYLGRAFGHRLDCSAGGRPLQLDGKTYASGLGLHSFCELTYELDAKCSTFIAMVGIDDAARPRGDAQLIFIGDGKELSQPLRLTGKDKPQLVRLSVHGVRTLTICVEFGSDGVDVGDHVDIADARLVK